MWILFHFLVLLRRQQVINIGQGGGSVPPPAAYNPGDSGLSKLSEQLNAYCSGGGCDLDVSKIPGASFSEGILTFSSAQFDKAINTLFSNDSDAQDLLQKVRAGFEADGKISLNLQKNLEDLPRTITEVLIRGIQKGL